MTGFSRRNEIDFLSTLPSDLLGLIFEKCGEECTGPPYRTFVQFQFLPGKTSYFEYTGEMRHGLPNGFGTLYHGSTYCEPNSRRSGRGSQTMWLYQPLLYVFPKQARLLCSVPS